MKGRTLDLLLRIWVVIAIAAGVLLIVFGGTGLAVFGVIAIIIAS